MLGFHPNANSLLSYIISIIRRILNEYLACYLYFIAELLFFFNFNLQGFCECLIKVFTFFPPLYNEAFKYLHSFQVFHCLFFCETKVNKDITFNDIYLLNYCNFRLAGQTGSWSLQAVICKDSKRETKLGSFQFPAVKFPLENKWDVV